MKIKEQTRKLTAGCSKHCFEVVDGTEVVSSKHCFEVVDRTDVVSSKHCFEVVDRTDVVSSKHCFEVVDRTDVVSSKHCFEVVDRTDEVSNHTNGKATLTRFEEIFEEYYQKMKKIKRIVSSIQHLIVCVFSDCKDFFSASFY